VRKIKPGTFPSEKTRQEAMETAIAMIAPLSDGLKENITRAPVTCQKVKISKIILDTLSRLVLPLAGSTMSVENVF
jgi:hypothetical protein